MASYENTFIRNSSPQYSDATVDSVPTKSDQKRPVHATNGGYYHTHLGADVVKPKDSDGDFAFWSIVTILFILAIGNLVLTLTIMGVLRLGRGMANLELVPEADTIKFYGIADLDRVYKRDGHLEGFADVPVSIEGVGGGSVNINLLRDGVDHNKINMAKNATHIKGVHHFQVTDRNTGDILFTTHKPRYNLVHGAANFHATTMINVARVTSPLNSNLTIQSRDGVVLKGAEGTVLDAKEILWTADHNVTFKSRNGSIIITGNDGVRLDMNHIPVAQGGDHGSHQYKLCICMPSGKLFRIATPAHTSKGCLHFNQHHDPCAI